MSICSVVRDGAARACDANHRIGTRSIARWCTIHTLHLRNELREYISTQTCSHTHPEPWCARYTHTHTHTGLNVHDELFLDWTTWLWRADTWSTYHAKLSRQRAQNNPYPTECILFSVCPGLSGVHRKSLRMNVNDSQRRSSLQATFTDIKRDAAALELLLLRAA